MSSLLVEGRDLVRSFRLPGGGSFNAVDHVSISIRRGETFGLVGESGSGKSTLAGLLLALERPTSGTVLFADRPIFALNSRDLRRERRHMQIVFQDPLGSLNRRKTVEQIVGLPLLVHERASHPVRQARVRELLAQVGLHPSLARRYPRELSGGQCQRVSIARAIALKPSFLVLDEAVSAIDVSVQAQILNLLRDLQQELGLTYLFVSHDLAVVRYMAERIGVMQNGKIVEEGGRDVIFGRPEHPYTQSLIRAVDAAGRAHIAAPGTNGAKPA